MLQLSARPEVGRRVAGARGLAGVRRAGRAGREAGARRGAPRGAAGRAVACGLRRDARAATPAARAPRAGAARAGAGAGSRRAHGHARERRPRARAGALRARAQPDARGDGPARRACRPGGGATPPTLLAALAPDLELVQVALPPRETAAAARELAAGWPATTRAARATGAPTRRAWPCARAVIAATAPLLHVLEPSNIVMLLLLAVVVVGAALRPRAGGAGGLRQRRGVRLLRRRRRASRSRSATRSTSSPSP